MTSKTLKAITIVLFWFVLPVFGQEVTDLNQRINRSIFNKIEFHLNQQETDSIYAMTSKEFQQALSPATFETVLKRQLYPLGRISNGQLMGFNENTGIYKLEFGSAIVQMALSVDSLNQISGLVFQPYNSDLEHATDTLPVVPDPEADVDIAIDEVANAYIRKRNTRALSIGVIHDGMTTSYYYGETERDNDQLPDEETLYEIGSISKTFTATLLAYLAQQNEISLDDPITHYLPDTLRLNEDLRDITLQQLANHTSGFPRLPDNLLEAEQTDTQNPYVAYTTEDLYDYLLHYSAQRAPGEEYEYSNLGFAVLGAILSNITGMDYESMVRDTIAAPLGLHFLKQHTTEDDQFIPVHNIDGAITPHWDFDVFAAAGGLRATTTDLLNYARAHFKMPETDLEHALAQTRQFTFFNPPDTDIGLGWHMTLEYGSLVFIHTGGTGGSNSYIAFSPDDKLAVVILSNAAESVAETGNTILEFLLEKNR